MDDSGEGIDSHNFKIESYDNDSKFKLFALKNVVSGYIKTAKV